MEFNKKCSKCKIDKPINNFTKQISRKDGLYPFCRECLKIENLIYKRSMIGLVNNMYCKMKERTSLSKHIYWYGKPILSKEKFEFWIYRNNVFKRLYRN